MTVCLPLCLRFFICNDKELQFKASAGSFCQARGIGNALNSAIRLFENSSDELNTSNTSTLDWAGTL